MHELTPREIVAELDRYIVGQDEAKRAVAIAIRNRWRRQQLSDDMRKEVTPKNIIMIGPTGVGKTEIARRLASLIRAPFCKVEATKYTEVGYHGRDVESVVRDLVEASFRLVKDQEKQRVRDAAENKAIDRIVDLLLPEPPATKRKSRRIGDDANVEDGSESPAGALPSGFSKEISELLSNAFSENAGDAELEPVDAKSAAKHARAKQRMREKVVAGELDGKKVTLKTESRHVPVQIFSNVGMEQMDVDLQSMFERIMPKESKSRELSVAEARRILTDQEAEGLIDKEAVGELAIRLAEESGIVFIDELDKICGPQSSHGPDVSRQGVQRDLLPIVEGTTVQTRYGPVRSEHILFIAAGAFHVSKPADLMPELQGRFPIRVELKDLGEGDFARILREPKNALTRQYVELLATEGVCVEFVDDAIDAMAELAHRVNKQTQNIGARRLHTILEKLLEDVSFDAPTMKGQTVRIDAAEVRRRLAKISTDEDLSRFIL